jgi:tRNA-2-methylthio-N6-dimethylallyladenosine synthase
VKSRRLAEVIALQQRITAEILGAQVGRRERVLVDHVSRRSATEYLTRTDEFRPVIVPAGPGVAPGSFLDVRITRATKATLFGTAPL